MARALLSEADISSSPVVAGMRLGGRSPDARTGCCGIHVRDGVKGVGAEGRTAFSPLGTMVDLSQWLYQTTCHSAADKSSIDKVPLMVGLRLSLSRSKVPVLRAAVSPG